MTMADSRMTFAGVCATLVIAAFATAAVICVIAWIPVSRTYGGIGVRAMLAGCGVSWLASCAGAVPIALAVSRASRQAPTAVLASTAARLFAALLTVVPLILTGWFDGTVLLVSFGASYLLLLLVDTALSVRMLKRAFEDKK